MTRGNASGVMIDEYEIGRPSAERARATSEVGAAIAHQLSGPLTALLLYVGDLSQNSDRFPAAEGGGQSLKEVAENALRETERVCLLMEQLGEACEAPLQKETAVACGREVINWWSQAGNGQRGLPPASEYHAHREPLTPRECEVLRLVREGCSNKEGGVRMLISYRTFESHRAEVMRKFGARNAADLIRLSSLPPAVHGTERRSGTAAQA
jgi:DNA-binding CsgD family transcriptional regulator